MKISLLSICIPVYKQKVRGLVEELLEEIEWNSIDVEILLLDNHSGKDFRAINSILADLPKVIYEELPHNIARSAVYNKLTHKAKGDYILFLDGDSRVIKHNFLLTYINMAQPGCVICGGRVYQKEKPATEYSLHWKYGALIESSPVDKRKAIPYRSFHTNNFLIDRKLFLTIQFDESLKQYGHDDTLFAYKLKKNQITIKHIDNPIKHDGLELGEVFLRKTRLSIENLAKLYRNQKPDFKDNVRLLRTYEDVRAIGLHQVLAFFFELLEKNCRKNLIRKNPSLRIFNLYKLAYFSNLMLKV